MRFLKHMGRLLKEFFGFAWQNKVWWIVPMVLVLLLLATPVVARAPLTDDGDRATTPAHDAGWTAQPTTAVSALLALTPAAATIAPAATSARALAGLRPVRCRGFADSATGLSVAVRPAPLVLRV